MVQDLNLSLVIPLFLPWPKHWHRWSVGCVHFKHPLPAPETLVVDSIEIHWFDLKLPMIERYKPWYALICPKGLCAHGVARRLHYWRRNFRGTTTATSFQHLIPKSGLKTHLSHSKISHLLVFFLNLYKSCINISQSFNTSQHAKVPPGLHFVWCFWSLWSFAPMPPVRISSG